MSLRGVLSRNLKSSQTLNVTRRAMSSDISGLKQRFADLLPAEQEKVMAVRKAIGGEKLGECTVAQAYGGMRGVSCMVYETSLLDSEEGIRFRGYSIPELQEQLPTAKGGEEPLPEGLMWLLLTGEIPTEAQTTALSAEFAARSTVPAHVRSMIKAFPKGMHPMTQFACAINALQTESCFAEAYRSGVHKSKYWESTYEDTMNLVARLPEVASLIYNESFTGAETPAYDHDLDYGGNYARMMGFEGQFEDLMRLYLVIHSDHEGGNVSAHTSHLVGSALSDPYHASAASMNGLAGPLHGLANQEVLRWLKEFKEGLGGAEITDETITKAVWDTLNSGQVIPGYGHAVLRKTDPRYECQRQFALKHLPDDEMFSLVSTLYNVVPGILTEHGKTKNPWPNVDAHSGVLLQYFGLTQEDYYTVMFGVSRIMGVTAQQVISRGMGLPIERPKSWTTDGLIKKFDLSL